MSDTSIKACKDFCPIYEAIEKYNHGKKHHIHCNGDFCQHIDDVVEANLKEVEDGR